MRLNLCKQRACYLFVLLVTTLIGAQSIWAQNVTVRGTVLDEKEQPLIGVKITEKGNSSNGVVSDFDGSFTINAPTNAILLFSYIGFETKEVNLSNSNKNTTLRITLRENQKILDEVVVIGYGESSKRNLTTAVAKLNPSDVSVRNVSTTTNMLQGQLPGVNVMMSNGLPGSRSNVSIRGVSSINGDNHPLIVIDGIQISKANATYNSQGEYRQDPLSMINPSDIKSIDVLKDAAASAIYGSRASNGVIIIETKTGGNTRPKISFSQLTGVQIIPRRLNLATSDQYMDLQKEAVKNHNTSLGLKPGSSGFIEINKVLGNVPSDYYDVDWQNLILKDAAFSNQSDISLTGGNQHINAFASIGYFNQEGLLKQTGLERFSARANVNFKLNDFIDFGLRLNGNKTSASSMPNGGVGTALFQRSLEQRPYDRPYKEDGSYMIGGKDILRHNGVQVLASEKNVDDNYQLLGSFFAGLKFLNNFTFRTSYNTELRHGFGTRRLSMLHPYSFGKGSTYERITNRAIHNFENTLSYKQYFGKLNVEAMLGHSFLKENYKYTYVSAHKFPSDDFIHISDATDIDVSGNKTHYALSSILGRVQLNYNDRYYISASLRRDGSSKFSKENRYDIFPAVSAAWTFSKEDFLRSVDYLSFGKLRISWGQTGNQDGIGNFSYLPLASGGYNYDGQTGLSNTSPGNQSLCWESSTQYDLGLDLSFLNDRIFVSYDFFDKRTNDLLYDLPRLGSTGFTSSTKNIGSMRNIGHEFSIDSENISTSNFSWKTSFNISFIKNKVTSLIDEKPISVSGWNAIIVGEPIGVFYAYKQEGIFQTMDEIPEKMQRAGVRPGDMKFKDVNGDDVINSSDLVVLGSPQPKFFGGFTNNFSFRNFDFSIFMNYAYGNKIASAWRSGLDHMGARDYNMIADNINNRWTGPGTSNFVPRASKSSFNNRNSSYYLEDGSFLKLKNITLGYTFSEAFMERISMNKIRIFASVNDIFKITSYSGYDPEASSSLDAKSAGQDNLVTPKPMSFLFGLNINF